MPPAQLAEFVAAIADGTPIEWDVVATDRPDLSGDLATRLQIVERIAQLYTGLPPLDSFSSPLHTSLLGVRLPGDDDSAVESPVTWGSLTIVSRIGRGTFGDVYRALDPRLDRPVALKLLRRKDRRASAVIAEGRLMARVRHPSVVTVYGAERIDGRVGLWMELVDGQTLEQELKIRGPFPPDEILTVGLDLSRALAAVHGAGLLHRDLKSQNVMRDAGGRIVLTDFGAGRELSEEGIAGDCELAGTPHYLAPEVLQGRPASAVSDVYSLGVLLYHLASGSFPVCGRSLTDLREAHTAGRLTPLKDARPDVPRSLAAVIERAVHPDPSRRIASAVELERALGAVAHPSPSRGRLLWTSAAALIVMTALGLGVAKWRQPSVAARLSFQPRDLVLITRFDNRTGETVFDGAVEYALERELSSSDTVGLVPRERVDDALALMKRPRDTIVDREVGREVALRDGRIKALLTGRIERFGETYVLSAQLIDPADNAVVATLTEDTTGQAGVLAALRRQAVRARAALGEHRDRLKGANPDVEPAATHSLTAFQLYNQSYQLGRQERWPAALAIARQLVAADPEFASGWVWLAWATNNVVRMPVPVNFPEYAKAKAKAREEYLPYIERASQLAVSVPEWERLWINGSYHTLLGDDARAVPLYQALLQLRPDHHYAANNLALHLRRLNRHDELSNVRRAIADQRPNDLMSNYSYAAYRVLSDRDTSVAQPYIERVLSLLPPNAAQQGHAVSFWLRWLPAYQDWESGDMAGMFRRVRDAEEALDARPAAVRDGESFAIGFFYLSLGRARDAARFLVDGGRDAWPLVAREERIPPGIVLPRPGVMVYAGRLDKVQEYVDNTPDVDPEAQAFAAVGRGELLRASNRAAAAIPYLREGVRALALTRFQDYYMACESLADAFARTNQEQEALRAIEECARERPRYNGNFFTRPFFWMRVQLRLADEYRNRGRIADAETIEAELRQRLVYADEDIPLVKRLKSRSGDKRIR